MENKVIRYSPYLEIITENREVRYLGYKMRLTASEYEILFVLASFGGYHDKKSICELINGEVKLSQKSIAVHIFSINNKSTNIGGRKIVGTDRKKGYFIEKYI